MVCDGYVKYEEAEVDRSAIMQDFIDNETKRGYFAIFELRKYHKITQIQNSR